MSRERELLLKCKDLFVWFAKNSFRVNPRAPIITEISLLLSPPEAEPSKTVYGVLATAYRPSQHEASMAAVERHKAGETPETNALAGKYFLVREMHGPLGPEHWIKCDSVREILSACAKMERQRDELRAENEELRNRWLATDGCISIPTTRYRELLDCLEAMATGKGNCDWRSVLNEHGQMLELNKGE